MAKVSQLRRVGILCKQFTRNLAHYRGGKTLVRKSSPEFWRSANSNSLDIAVLEWCKLFGGPNEKHSWEKIVKNPKEFESDILTYLNISNVEFLCYQKTMRAYRDKFLAHLDDLPVMHIPVLEIARKSVIFYYQHIVENELSEAEKANWGPPLSDYFEECKLEAKNIYKKEL